MERSALSIKTKKVIEMNRDAAVFQGVYFSPLFLSSLASKVPELGETGFVVQSGSTESDNGKLVYGKIISPEKAELNLGSILLDGATIVVKNKLVPVEKLVSFIAGQ